MNPLYGQLNGRQPQNDIVSRFNQFRQSIKGDPQDMIRQMLNSGRITQSQYNNAVQQAQALGKLLGMK